MLKIFKKSKGQTLIETLVAVFILTMGITAAVGLAIFALSSSSSVAKQIIATGLAREGIEAVKNMRDTNWLKIASIDTNCYDYETGSNNARCYKSWLNPPESDNFDLDPPSDEKSYSLEIDPSGQLFWDLKIENSKYGLDFDSNISGLSFKGFYKPNTVNNFGSSNFYRKIILKTNGVNDDSPYNRNIGPKLQVISQVWWTDKNCPRSANWPGLGKCSVEIQTNLTNWRNF